MSDWYYAENNEQKGPVVESDLKGMLSTHKLPADALVWKEGMAAWTPASQVAALGTLTSTAPRATSTASSATTISNPSSTTPVTVADVLGKPESLEVDPDDAEKYKIFGIIAYLPFFCLVPIFAVKDSPFAKYHANQGLTLFLAEIALWVVLWIIQVAILAIMPSGFNVLGFLFQLVWLAPLALTIFGIINAAAGKCVPLPVIGGVKLLK
jgi:uncharacterized membrane protein